MKTNNDNNATSINILHPGAAPVALSLARVAGIREIVDQYTGWGPDSRSTSPGILAESLVAAILCGCRPLYKVESFWENKAVEVFYKDEGINAQQLNDDAYARMLDKLAGVDRQLMFESVCLRMLQYHGLDIVLTHSDTTSVSVEGMYDEAKQSETQVSKTQVSEPIFRITYGHSKDHRPDLKQIKMGLSVQQEGLPISGELLSGNKSDQVWNPEAVQKLSELLLGQGYENTIFLADCALVSTDSLLMLADRKIQFISRFPEMFNLAEELKDEAWRENSWEELGQLTDKPTEKTASYRTWNTTRQIEGEEFSFVVVHSSNLEDRKKRTLEKVVERIQKDFERKSGELKKQPYACEPDARSAGEKLERLVESKGFECNISVNKTEVSTYGHKGRPKKGEIPKIQVAWNVDVKIGDIRPEVLEEQKRHASTFILVYRLSEEMSSKEILISYKNQDKVEQGFKFLKQPQYLGPIYVKKASRVESLGYIFLLVLLLAKYLEYRVRVSMAESGGELKVGGQKVLRPTTKTILEFLDEMLILCIAGQLMLPDNISESTRKIIHWSGFDESVYICGFTPDAFVKNHPPGKTTAK